MRTHIGSLAIALAIALAALSTAVGTQSRYVPTAPGVWKPWAFTGGGDATRRLGARPPDVSAVDASLKGLVSILRKTPGFSAPIGFSIETTGTLDLETMDKQAIQDWLR